LQLYSRLRDEFAFLHGNVRVLMTSWVLMNFAGAIPSTYYSLYILGLEGTPAIIGIVDFVSFLALALVQFPGGYLADKHGRRSIIVTFTFGMALSNLIFAFAPSWHFILIAVTVSNLSLIYQPALAAILADSIPPEKRGIGFSLGMFVNNIASILSPAVAAFLFTQYGLIPAMRVAFLIVVCFYFAAALLRIKLTETLQNRDNGTSLASAIKEYPKAVKQGLSVWKDLPRSMFFLFLTNALASFIFAMTFSYMLVYANEILHISEFNWALLMMWFTASMILLALPSGKLTDKIGRKKPLLASWIFLGAYPLLFIWGNLPILYIAFLFFGVSNALFAASYQALEADLVPRELRGKEVGCSQFITYILMSVGGLAGGFFYEYVSPMVPFMLSFLVTIPCAIITWFFIQESEMRQT
jgi:MFS family permease